MTPREAADVLCRAWDALGVRAPERANSLANHVLTVDGEDRVVAIAQCLGVLNREDYREGALRGRPKAPPGGWPPITTLEIADLTARAVRALAAEELGS